MTPKNFYNTIDKVDNDDFIKYFDKTYKLTNLRNFIDSREAVKQAVTKILNTERFKYPIYSSDYGVELDDLFGMDCDYVCVELERRISEALLVDNRIDAVTDFNFVVKTNVIFASFVVHTALEAYVLENFEFKAR